MMPQVYTAKENFCTFHCASKTLISIHHGFLPFAGAKNLFTTMVITNLIIYRMINIPK